MFVYNLTMKQKLALSFSVVIVLFTVAICIGVAQIRSISNTSHDVYHHIVKPLETLEAFKSEFAELRRLENATMTDALHGDKAAIRKSIENTEQQYGLLLAAGNAHINRLAEADENQDGIDLARNVMEQVTNNVWPHVQRINAAALSGDVDALLAEKERCHEIASVVTEEFNSMIKTDMALSAEKTSGITDAAGRAMIILFTLGVVAMAISFALAAWIGSSIAKRINALRTASREVANGNLSVSLGSNAKDELGELSRDLALVVDSLDNVMRGLTGMIDDFKAGSISAQMDTSQFQGAYRAIVEDINAMFAMNMNEMIVFLNCVAAFADGDFSAEIPRQPGERALINESFDGIKNALQSVVNDVGDMVDAASSGHLSVRTPAERYKGDWAGIMEKLNQLMEAISAPISEAEDILEHVSNGDFSHRITGDMEGEFLLIKSSVNDMAANISSYIGEISDTLRAVSQNDLNRSITREYVGEFSLIKEAINDIIEKFNQVIAEISGAAQQVAAGAGQISESSMSLAQGTSQQASAVEELNATMQAINENTAQNAESAREADNLSSRSKENAAIGDREMRNMLISMAGIKDSSNSISKIIQVIDDIAFQTNLLALNAAVEAARAGAHGKGFAVVAEEVRSLAARCQRAAKETAQLIEESINRVNEGTQMADATALALQTIVEDVGGVSELIGNIAAASREQAEAISQVMEGLSQITEVVQSNSATSQEAASASEELSGQSLLLRGLVDVFKLKKD